MYKILFVCHGRSWVSVPLVAVGWANRRKM